MARETKSSKSSKTKENKASEPDESVKDALDSVSEATESGGETGDGDSGVEASDAAADDVIEDAVLIEDGEASQDDSQTSDERGPEVAGALPLSGGSDSAPGPAPAAAQSSRIPLLALIFGGLLAGALGYLGATLGGPGEDTNSAALERTVSELSSEVESLRSEIAAAADVTVDLPESADLGPLNEALVDLNLRVGVVNEQIDRIWTEIQAAEERLGALESRPVASFSDGSAAMEAQLEAFRTELDTVTAEARAEVEAARARASEIELAAAEAAAKADRDAAMAEIASALDAGTAFSEPLSRLEGVPEGLRAVSDSGVPTLVALQADFPGAARAALAEAQVVPEDASATDRLAAFLRRQTNARSLSPQDGEDVDAILSRAENALSTGSIADALNELQMLADPARAAMSDWIAAAETRASAMQAFGDLAEAQN